MTFDKDLSKRYRGHIALCEIDLPGQQAISRARVLVAGAGGLGSPVAMYLAAAGVGTIGIVDADTVSLSNLQRQIMHRTADIGRLKTESATDTLTAINPNIKIEPHQTMLDRGNADSLIARYDLVIDCTDNFDSRLLINDTCVRSGKPYIHGSVSRFTGQVFTYLPGSCDYRAIYGDETPEYEAPCAIDGILNTVVGVIGTLQATEAVKYLAGVGDLLANRLLVFDAITMKFSEFTLTPPTARDSHI